MTLRCLISSNGAHVSTGYGQQTALMLPRFLALGHEIGMFAWYGAEGAIVTHGLTYGGKEYTYPVYPKWRDGYGSDIVEAHAKHFKADLVLTLIDAWVLDAERHGGARRWAPYFPVDSEPIPPPVLAKVKDAAYPIVYSQFGLKMARDANLSPAYVPHMVDTALFLPGDMAAARQRLKWPQDAFIAVMVAANKGFPSRKNFVEQLTAFARLARRHSDALIYLHTQDGEPNDTGGVNLRELTRDLGIADRVIWADQYAIRMGYPADYLRTVYQAGNVLLSVSAGEGFGVPIVEAQACGMPVIVGAWTAMEELCGAGWTVAKTDAYPVYTPLAAYQFVPRVDAVESVLTQAYIATGGKVAAAMRQQARIFAERYDADLVAREYWGPLLEQISSEVCQ